MGKSRTNAVRCSARDAAKRLGSSSEVQGLRVQIWHWLLVIRFSARKAAQLVDELDLPFETTVLGVTVTVKRADISEANEVSKERRRRSSARLHSRVYSWRGFAATASILKRRLGKSSPAIMEAETGQRLGLHKRGRVLQRSEDPGNRLEACTQLLRSVCWTSNPDLVSMDCSSFIVYSRT